MFEQLDDPSAENLPEEQTSHAMEPEVTESMLTPQLEQSVAPELGWYMPALHLVQTLESEAPDKIEAVPTSHPWQVAEPDVLEYEPGGQTEQKLADDAEY